MPTKDVETVEEIETTTDEGIEPKKKGLTMMLLIVGIVALLQCGVLVVIFKDEIMSFFDGMKSEPAEVALYYPLEEFSVNLLEPKHLLRATLSVEYKDETLTPILEEKQATLQSTILEVLRSKSYQEVDSVEDTRQLATEIVAALNKTFETEAFSDIHFTGYLYQ